MALLPLAFELCHALGEFALRLLNVLLGLRQIDGLREAPLGTLWRPKYFNGGIAIHGSPSIPGQPASHGCARLHDAAMDLLWDDDLVPVGTPVWVY